MRRGSLKGHEGTAQIDYKKVLTNELVFLKFVINDYRSDKKPIKARVSDAIRKITDSEWYYGISNCTLSYSQKRICVVIRPMIQVLLLELIGC